MFQLPVLELYASAEEDDSALKFTQGLVTKVFESKGLFQTNSTQERLESLDITHINSDTATKIDKINPNMNKLLIIAGSNMRHQSTYHFVKYFAGHLDDLVYVHFDLHPDAHPSTFPAELALELDISNYSRRDLGLGTFVYPILGLPTVKTAVMFGYRDIPEENNYNPHRIYSKVFGPAEIVTKDELNKYFKGKNIYVSIDGDVLKDWKGFMCGNGKMETETLIENINLIAEAGNLVGVDLTGFARTQSETISMPKQLILLGELRLELYKIISK